MINKINEKEKIQKKVMKEKIKNTFVQIVKIEI